MLQCRQGHRRSRRLSAARRMSRTCGSSPSAPPCDFIEGATSSAGLRSKKPKGFSQNEIASAGITGQSSTRGDVVYAEDVPEHDVDRFERLVVGDPPGEAVVDVGLRRVVAARPPLVRVLTG